MIAALAERGRSYARAVSQKMSATATTLYGAFIMIALSIFFLRLFALPREASEAGVNLLKQMTWWSLGSFFLKNTDSLFDWVFDLMQMTALQVGIFILNVATADSSIMPNGPPSIGAAGTGSEIAQSYGQLWGTVEFVIYPIACSAFSGTAGTSNIGQAFAYFILALPYMFVLGVFAAFLVQSMFYFTAIAAFSPILILGLAFEKTRGGVGSGFRIILTGTLTIGFAAIAMGFTAMILFEALGQLRSLRSGGSFWDWIPVANWFYSAGKLIISPAYWSAFIIGFVSILLHLAAPRLAANISGATDSAASAAAVVGAGQLLASRAIMGGQRLLTGSAPGQIGGAAGLAMRFGAMPALNALRGAAGGGLSAAGGALGGGPGALAEKMRAGME